MGPPKAQKRRIPPGDPQKRVIGREFEPDADRAGASSRPQRLAQSAARAPILTSSNFLQPLTEAKDGPLYCWRELAKPCNVAAV